MKEERISGLETSDMDLEGAIREPIFQTRNENSAMQQLSFWLR